MINITKNPSTPKKKKKTWKIKTKKKTIEIPVKDVLEVAIFIIVLFSVTFGTFWILQASLKTKTPMVVVTSGSMEPTIYEGDLLFIKGVDPSEINNGSEQGDPTGDIIIFEAIWNISDEPIVHRVIDKRFNFTGDGSWEFQTQGDNVNSNPNPDPGWTHEDDVIGIVVGKIRYIGFVKIWLTKSGMAIPLIVILALCLMVSIAWDLTHPDEEEDEKKKSKRKLFRRKKEPEKLEESDEEPSVNLGV